MSQLPISATSSFPEHFAGCLRHISIDEKKLPLVPENVQDARNVIDCDGTPCGGETCLNGGTCWSVPFNSRAARVLSTVRILMQVRFVVTSAMLLLGTILWGQMPVLSQVLQQ